MAGRCLSSCFDKNVFYWKILGLWPGRTPSMYYKLYSVPYLFLVIFMYNILLTLNLIYTPRTIELFIPEVIFYFTEIQIAVKISMIIFKRKQILEAFDLLDRDLFKGDDDFSKKLIKDSVKKYSNCLNSFSISCHISYIFLDIVPLFTILAFGADRVLPIVKYYFLSDEIRDDYFMYWYVYQSLGIYIHMSSNITNDSYISGIIWMAVTQLKVINHKLRNVKLEESEQKFNKNIQEQIMYNKLVRCLKHYELYLKYYSTVQEIINFAMFISFGVAACIICVVLCGLTLLPSSTYSILFMLGYQLSIICEIFVPAWLGTHLTYENQELVFAAYNSDWIPRSAKFKRSLRLFVERANMPMVLKGFQMFPLALATFITVMKFSYSSFTLVRKMHVQQNKM